MKISPRAPVAVAPIKKFLCPVDGCGAQFSKAWRQKQHLCGHTGEKPFCCDYPECGRSFSRRDRFAEHRAKHGGQKALRCPEKDCEASYVTASLLQKHCRRAHGGELKCTSPGCQKTFRKKAAMKSHLQAHGPVFPFKCLLPSCGMKFESAAKRRAHHRRHAGYPCPINDCKTIATSWSKRMKHLKTHPVEYNCLVCEKAFKKQNGLKRHVCAHAPKKPVLMCPREDCKAYFTTLFNLEHHIKKDHLKLLRYSCYFPDCEKAFAMRTSLIRHLVVHDPDRRKLQLHPRRAKRSWKRRWNSHCRNGAMVECNLSRLFNHKLSFRIKPKVEADLSGLFNERKLRYPAVSEVNLESLFHLPARKKVEKA